MNINMAVLAGRLATEPELKTFDSGKRMMRLLITVRSTLSSPRLDVIPVVWWDPDEDFGNGKSLKGRSVWIVGSIQRRFWAEATTVARQSRIEVIAADVVLHDEIATVKDPRPSTESLSTNATYALLENLILILDGTEWNGDVLDEISDAFNDAGLNLRSPDSP